ncbi:MAG: carboxypeptidase regulatory-like domain-containing protein, partial [Armatimonadota bacterium]
GAGKYTSIAVNSSGFPAITYYDETNDRLKYAYQDAGGWHIEVIATGCGRSNSLAIDSSGNSHVAYYDLNLTLKYAKRAGTWSYETVDSQKFHGEMCSIALNSSGFPCIAYRNGFNGQLNYAYKDGSGWHIEVADSQDRTGFCPALAIGTDGVPRINYYRRAGYSDGTNWYALETWYAHKSGGVWQKQLIERIKSTNDQWCMSMVLDSSNRPCVAYHYFQSKSLLFMQYDGSSFSQQTVDSGRELGQYASITLDTLNNPHISYYAIDDPNLFYVRKSGTTWYNEQVDTSGDTGGYSSIKMLPTGYPAISYCKSRFNWDGSEYTMTADLKYAYKDSSGWHPSAIQANTGMYTSLWIQNGTPCISYGDLAWKSMSTRFAQWNGGGWDVQTVDAGSPESPPEGDWHADGLWTSLAFDQTGNPHVSYMEHWQDFGSTPENHVLKRRLMHAWRAGGVWYTEIVEDGQFGKFSSIAIDPSGYPCIAYQDVGNGYLKYAYKTPSGWVKEVVDSSSTTGWYASLCLNAAGYPRIAYKDLSNQSLKYAWKDGAGWHVEVVDNAGRVGDYCSLAVSSTGEPYIVYMDWDNLTLKFAYPSPQQYGTVTGYVRNAGGQPISGATVMSEGGAYSTTSGTDGSYSIGEVLPGTYNMIASKTGYQSQTIVGVQVSANQTTVVNFNLSVIPPGTISGIVKDTSNNPLVGVLVSTNIGGYSTTTTSGGNYSMSVPPGTYNLTASKSGYQSQTQNNIVVTSGNNTTVNFTLSPVSYGTISGVVRDTNGTTLGGATVSTSTGGYSTTSASNGTFTLSNVLAGTYSVTASKSGYNSQTQNNIAVAAGQTTTCNFNLPPASPNLVNGNFESGFTSGVGNGWTKFLISGSPSFVDETSIRHGGSHAQRWWTNWTVHDAGIYQQVTAAQGINYIFTAWTWRHDEWNNGGDNEATWVGIDPYGGTNASSSSVIWSLKEISYETWTQQTVTATAQAGTITVFIRGRANWAGNTMMAVTDDAVLTLTAPNIGHISGYVKDSNNNPIVGALITTGTGGYTAMSGSNGSYNLSNLLTGSYSVTASKSGYQSQTKTGITVTAGQTTSCNFSLTANPGSVVGVVLDRNTGAPISDALVSTNVGGYTTTTNSSGSYTLSNVTPGSYTVSVTKSGYGPKSSNVTIVPGETATADFSLSPAYSRVSEVKKQPDGKYIYIADVVCSRRPNSSLMFVQDADRTAGIKVTAGTGSIPPVSPGTVCSIEGRLTSAGDVRAITDVGVVVGSSGNSPYPILMSNATVGGANFYYHAGPPAIGQKGSLWGTGVNNVGLLVTTFGRVIDVPVGGVFHIDDGSIPGGLPVKLLDGVTAPTQASFAVLTGIAEPDGLLLLLNTDKVIY